MVSSARRPGAPRNLLGSSMNHVLAIDRLGTSNRSQHIPFYSPGLVAYLSAGSATPSTSSASSLPPSASSNNSSSGSGAGKPPKKPQKFLQLFIAASAFSAVVLAAEKKSTDDQQSSDISHEPIPNSALPTREQNIDTLQKQAFDILVIGGGYVTIALHNRFLLLP